jgi:hypothetical protein
MAISALTAANNLQKGDLDSLGHAFKPKRGLQGSAQNSPRMGRGPAHILSSFKKAAMEIRPKYKSSTAPMSYGNKLASLKAGTKSFIIWLNKNYVMRIQQRA